jgi:hypothetical protein
MSNPRENTPVSHATNTATRERVLVKAAVPLLAAVRDPDQDAKPPTETEAVVFG